MDLERYVGHLVGDLEEAARNSPVRFSPANSGNEAAVTVSINSMAELVGIEREVFPPAEQLTEQQLTQLVRAIDKLWLAYNLYTFFPDTVPVAERYRFILAKWDEGLQYRSNQMSRIPSCTNQSDNCPFGTYCACQESYDDTIKRYGLN